MPQGPFREIERSYLIGQLVKDWKRCLAINEEIASHSKLGRKSIAEETNKRLKIINSTRGTYLMDLGSIIIENLFLIHE